MEFKNPLTQLENTKESLASRMNQAGDKISELEDKVQCLEQISKKYQKFN